MIPPIDTSPENLAYISSLKVGERVIECEPSNCMRGKRGVVYESKSGGGLCVKWDMGNGDWMGTSVTWGTRRLADAPDSMRVSQ